MKFLRKSFVFVGVLFTMFLTSLGSYAMDQQSDKVQPQLTERNFDDVRENLKYVNPKDVYKAQKNGSHNDLWLLAQKGKVNKEQGGSKKTIGVSKKISGGSSNCHSSEYYKYKYGKATALPTVCNVIHDDPVSYYDNFYSGFDGNEKFSQED